MAMFSIITKGAGCHRLLANAKSKLCLQNPAVLASSFTMKTVPSNVSKLVPGEDFELKNQRLQRPISPHLSIYSFQSTMAFSISHRATGLILSGITYGLAAGAIFLPGSYPHYLEMLQNMHMAPLLIYTAKFLLAFPLTYHTGNGLRHLNWDMGNNFTIQGNSRSGFISFGVSLLAALYLASL